MPNTTARLGLPMIAPSQAQKHVTHNEALQSLDALTQLVLAGLGSETPPAVPGMGDIHALGPAPTGAWAGQGGQLAQWVDPDWHFTPPQEGWRAWDLGAARPVVFDGAAWVPMTPDLDNLEGVGIGTASDAVNRLAVAAEASLFSHAGAGHQLKINKAAATDTCALLYQSGWAGHAEMGLAGDTDFHIKVSPDGSTWTEALVLDATTGHAGGAAVQSGPTDTTPGRLARADYAYGPGNLLGFVGETGGMPTGAVIERGSNANGSYVRFADGTQICWRTHAETSPSWVALGGGYRLSTSPVLQWAASFSDLPAICGHIKEYAFLTPGAFQNSTDFCSINVQSLTQPAGPLTFVMTALGRWF